MKIKARDLRTVEDRVPVLPASLRPVDGGARLTEWTRDGTLVTVGKVQAAWGVQRQTVDAAREQHEIFSIWVRGEHWYPGEALRLNRNVLADINRALGDIDPTSKLLFLLREQGALGGHKAADAVGAGKLADVLRLATEWTRT